MAYLFYLGSVLNYSSIYQKLIKTYSLFPRYFLDGYGLWPIQIYVEVTYRCNLECEFCQFGGQRTPADNELSADELGEGLREVGRGAIVSFTGGEPFVKRGFMRLLEGGLKEESDPYLYQRHPYHG